MAKARADARPIIVKKIKKVAGGHHGGAWKVAYADFVTAMMAFFMLLWLLTVSDKVTLQGIADYFTPSNATMSNSSGSGSILAGQSLEKEGAKASGSITPSQETSQKQRTEEDAARDKQDNQQGPQSTAWESKLPTEGDTQLLKAEQGLNTAIQEIADLHNNRDHIIVEQTPDGLRVQLVDRDQRPMFRPGGAELYPYAKKMITALGTVIAKMENRLSIQGHTDKAGAESRADYTNWELSSDRANAARRALLDGAVPVDRFAESVGKASTEPMFPDDPLRPENRRITLLLIREAPAVDPDFGEN